MSNILEFYILPILLIFATIATFLVLARGVIGLCRKIQKDPRHSNQLMQWRIKLQFLAIMLFILIMGLK